MFQHSSGNPIGAISLDEVQGGHIAGRLLPRYNYTEASQNSHEVVVNHDIQVDPGVSVTKYSRRRQRNSEGQLFQGQFVQLYHHDCE